MRKTKPLNVEVTLYKVKSNGDTKYWNIVYREMPKWWKEFGAASRRLNNPGPKQISDTEKTDVKTNIDIHRKEFQLYLLIDKNDEVYGYFWIDVAKYYESTAYIREVFVREKYRGYGLGRFMMEQLAIQLKKEGFKYTILDVLENNITAKRLYATNGYVPMAVTMFKKL